MRTKFLMRPARPEDAPLLANVKARAAYAAYAEPGDPHALAELEAWIARRCAIDFIAERIKDTQTAGGQFLLAATEAGNVLGGGQVRPEVVGGVTGGYLSDLYVHPAGRGVGTALMGELLRHADGPRGWTTVRCFVFSTNAPALSFFESFGFREVGRQPNRELTGELVELHRPRPTA